MPDTLPHHRTEPRGEEVLASLRRLVAERPAARAPLELTRAQRRPAEAAPLVLTAAQRVRPPRAPAAQGLDDAALRALVASAVRDELRGEIGTHLTRRLRRMVREEIALALESRDLEH